MFVVGIVSVSNHSTVTVNCFFCEASKVSFAAIPSTVYLIPVGSALFASVTPDIVFKTASIEPAFSTSIL